MHIAVLKKVTDFAVDYGFTVRGLDFSPIQGGHGNIEFLAHLEKSAVAENFVSSAIEPIVEKAHEEFKKDEKE